MTCHFQNSCDQDYDFEDWKGVPYFEFIAEKWKNATDSEVIEHYRNDRGYDYDEEYASDLDYYRRSFAYDEIWSMCESYLYHEEDVVYISMFGGYEIAEGKGFVRKCRKAYEEWQKQFEKPKENEVTENDK
ncbi:MAG: hypothetical protein IJ445_06960 [Clostridia bacterium]|nr:hypothetical protein [Clostridia bacterium]